MSRIVVATVALIAAVGTAIGAEDRAAELLEQIAVCREFVRSRPDSGVRWIPYDPALIEAARERVRAYLMALGYLEELIGSRQIDAPTALDTFSNLTTHELLYPFPFQTTTIEGEYHRLVQDELAIAERAEERFLRDVYPSILELPLGPFGRHPTGRYEVLSRWQGALVEALVFRVDRTYRTGADLEMIHEALTWGTPDGLGVGLVLDQFVSTGVRYVHFSEDRSRLGPSAMREEDWLNFLRSLRDSPHRVMSWAGRYALLRRRYLEKEVSPEFLEELDALLREFEEIPFAAPTRDRRSSDWAYGRAEFIRDWVARQLAAGVQEPR